MRKNRLLSVGTERMFVLNHVPVAVISSAQGDQVVPGPSVSVYSTRYRLPGRVFQMTVVCRFVPTVANPRDVSASSRLPEGQVKGTGLRRRSLFLDRNEG